MPKTKSIKDEAAKYLDLFEEKKKDDKTYMVFKSEVIMQDNEYYEKISEIMRKIECSQDFVYEQTCRCLEWLVDEAPEDSDEIEDILLEVIDGEVDVYTSGLTEWLNQSNYHVYYLTDALESGIKDGFQLLSLAQYHAIEEVWRGIIDLVRGE